MALVASASLLRLQFSRAAGELVAKYSISGTGEGAILRRRQSTEAAEAAEREEYERQQSLIASQQTAIMRAAASGATAPSGIPATTPGLLQKKLNPA